MSIQTELLRIKTNVSNTLNAIQAHGGVVPLDANSNDMATCVKTIPTGTGGGEQYYIEVNEDYGTVTANKTFEEINDAYNSGKELICIYSLTRRDDSGESIARQERMEYPLERAYPNAMYRFSRLMQLGGASQNDNFVVIQIAREDENKAIVSTFKSRYALFAEIPSKLPNPNALTIKQGDKSWKYTGAEAVNVELPEIPEIPEPVTSLPWSAITDVPFRAGGIALDETLTMYFEGGQWPILTPFSIKDGRVYTVTIGENTYENLTAQTTYMEPDVPESKVVFLGNPYFFGGENNNLLFILACLETPLEEAGIFIYGLLMGVSEEFMQSTLYVKIDGGETIPLDPELIPTMSETVKGGAKVGEGLEVVGDTLNAKTIVITKNGNNYTYTKTPAEIYALGEDVLNYDVTVIDVENDRKYTATGILKITDTYIQMGFNALSVKEVGTDSGTSQKWEFHYGTAIFYKSDNMAFGIGSYDLIQENLPTPSTDKRILLSEEGGYRLYHPSVLNNPLLQAVDMNGTLIAVQTKPLMELVNAAITSGNVHVNLVVLKDVVDMANGIANTYNIYRLIKVDGVASGNPLGFFANEVDTGIVMDADGNFTYFSD